MAVPTWVDNSTAITAATLQSMTNADTTEAATNAALGGSASWQDNLNRIRAAISLIVAGNATTGMATLLTSAVQMLPLSQKGAASGVASLNGSSQVVQAGAVNPVTAGAASGLATLNGSSLVVQDPASKGLASGVAALDGSSRLTATATASALTVNGALSIGGVTLDTLTKSVGVAAGAAASPAGTPSMTLGPGAGSASGATGTLSAGASARQGIFFFTTGTTPFSGNIAVTINLGVTFPNLCKVKLVQLWNGSNAPFAPFVQEGNSYFNLVAGGILTASQRYDFSYEVESGY